MFLTGTLGPDERRAHERHADGHARDEFEFEGVSATGDHVEHGEKECNRCNK